ncbi:MAG: hypothetical protein OEZ58_11165 [Gammaproteobacteria bacterium]|nr:hypothetical protein [Gammaproteobacteria bacterium]
MRDDANLQLIGFGPAALGIFVTADRMGAIDELIRRGIVIHERLDSIEQWDCINYRIRSNSPLKDFLQGIRPDGIFKQCISSSFKNLTEQENETIYLNDISEFLKKMVRVVIEKINQSNISNVVWSSQVDHISIENGFSVFNDDQRELNSKHLLLACGSSNKPLLPEHVSRKYPTKVIPSDSVLRGNSDHILADWLGKDQPIIILGGAHSAFSTVCYLLEHFSYLSNSQKLHLVSRREVLEWEISEHGGKTNSDNKVILNRFSGLRGDAKDMFQKIKNGKEKRVKLNIGTKMEVLLDRLFDKSSSFQPLVINATGYQSRVPWLVGKNNVKFKPDMFNGNIAKLRETQELTYQGEPIPKLYGLGLGYSDVGKDGTEVGINLYHGRAAENILNNVLL